MVALPFLALVLPGCESDAAIAADMERGLREGNVALLGGLLSAELLSHLYDEPDTQLRHGGAICGCPCTERIGTDAPYVLTLDYDPYGCVPESQLLPTALSGHAAIDYDGSECNFSWDALTFALEHEVGGDLRGNVEVGDVVTIEADGGLTIGPETLTVDLRIAIDANGTTLDGTVTVEGDDPRPTELVAVTLPFEAISPPCPAPDGGEATLVNADHDDKSVVIDFGDPGEGFVTVERDQRVSESTDWCAYASELW